MNLQSKMELYINLFYAFVTVISNIAVYLHFYKQMNYLIYPFIWI